MIPEDLIGRLITLNLARTKTFRCGGFSLSPNTPTLTVTPGAQQNQIKMGLLDGRLIDITDQNINGLEVKGTQHTKPVVEDTDERVFVTVSPSGAMSVAIPKDKEQQEEWEKMIAITGVLILPDAEISTKRSPLVAGMVSHITSPYILENMSETIQKVKKIHE